MSIVSVCPVLPGADLGAASGRDEVRFVHAPVGGHGTKRSASER